MAIEKVARRLISPQVPVDVYRNGKLVRSYDSVSECARDLHVSYSTVKYLIASGKELYTVPDSVTLDIPSYCPYSFVLSFDSETGRYWPEVRDDRTGEMLGV